MLCLAGGSGIAPALLLVPRDLYHNRLVGCAHVVHREPTELAD
jgi:hypothetical protein